MRAVEVSQYLLPLAEISGSDTAHLVNVSPTKKEANGKLQAVYECIGVLNSVSANPDKAPRGI
ncbi:hypothetical protein ACVW1B_006040 [Bradyrhizobium sp. USDA 4502]